jgi:hypothetical protein
MKIRLISVILAVTILGAWQSSAEAARAFGISQSPALGSEFNMRSTQTITYTITNSNTAGSTDRIYRVRFRLSGTCTGTCTPTAFSGTTAAPANWTKTTSTATTVEFRATSWAFAIPSTGTRSFPVVFNMGSMGSDTTETLLDVRSRFTTTSTFCYSGCAPLVNASTSGTVTLPTGSGGTCAVMTSAGTPAVSTCVSWTLKALSMTLVPSTFNVGTGCQFTLTMTVTNNSTAAVTATSVAKPPAPTGVSVSTVSNPANLSLGVLGTGSMVWTYTAGGTAGTVTFAACSSTGAGCNTVSGTSKTSSTVTTSAITVSSGSSCNLIATIVVTACVITGDTANFVMTVTNTTGGTVTNVTPSALTKFTTGAAAIGTFSPSSQTPISINNNSSGTFTWTAPVTGNVNDTYYVTGNATAAGPITTSTATSNTGHVGGYTVAVNPASTNAGSTNQELIWTIQNTGCADVKQVQITIPTLPSVWGSVTDTYSLIEQFNPPNPGTTSIENVWTVSIANPVSFAATILPPSASTDVLPLVAGSAKVGTFSLVFSTTPAVANTYTFTIQITDANNKSVSPTTDVQVNAFNSGAPNPNANSTDTIREDIR